jgi:uncharacterized protein (DUF4213/DUF364 family)
MRLAVQHVDGLRFLATAGSNAVVVDAAPEDGGAGTAMSAPQLFAAAMGACVCEFVTNSCQLHDIPFERLGVEIVGHFPFVERVRQAAAECWVLELHPRPGDLSAERAAEVLPQADVVALTGTSLINHTFDELIALCRRDAGNRKAYVVLLGASAPLSPVLFEYGVDAVSGTRVVDVPAVLRAASQGATFRQIPGKRLLTLMKEQRTILE